MPKREPIVIPGLDVPRAKRYSRVKLGLLGASLAWSVGSMVWLARQQRAKRLQARVAEIVPDQRLTAPAFLATISAGTWLAGLPLAYVSGLAVERAFGLTKQSTGDWFSDQVKALAVGTALQTPLLTAAFVVIRRRPHDWWLILAGATVPLMVLLSNLAPVLLMPLFNTFTPLRDEQLREQLLALAERSGVRVADVYEMDMSRQSEKPNAMFTGLGNTKRIVLGDTLLRDFAPEETSGVVAHELGHQVHGDIWRLIALGGVMGFGSAWALHKLAPPVVAATHDQTGVTGVGDEAAYPLFAILGTALGLLAAPAQGAFSRWLERRADRYAIALTDDPEAYARALERLASASLADPDPPRAVVFMLASHPPIAERIRVARATLPA
ncbi:MAG: M48 family metallopeptidase [Thermomicrobiales bacterium]|nr:M48 family metallopeptidase [Thermomicrobiales bacterium]